jgi:hypothetical protein
MLDIVNRAHNDPDKKNTRKAFKWILFDSIIIGAIAMCAAMPSTVPTAADLWVMFKAFLGSFILQLAIERGLKKDKQND